jgi:threonine aldolase
MAVSITQQTEAGGIYTPDEIGTIAEIAKGRDLPLHMDGSRFANALVHLGVAPAEMTWKAGVDLLSLGATKNGCIGAEAVVCFDAARAADLPYVRKRAGQLFSKSRFIAAQFDAWFRDGLWLKLARHANAMAGRLRSGLAARPHAREAWATDGNEIFVVLKRADADRLRQAGARFHDWHEPHGAGLSLAPDEILVRLVTSFVTEPEDVDRLLGALGPARGA